MPTHTHVQNAVQDTATTDMNQSAIESRLVMTSHTEKPAGGRLVDEEEMARLTGAKRQGA